MYGIDFPIIRNVGLQTVIRQIRTVASDESFDTSLYAKILFEPIENFRYSYGLFRYAQAFAGIV